MKLEDIQQGADEELDIGAFSNRKPKWLDKERFLRGQRFFQDHLAMSLLSMHCSLVCGFVVSNLLEALVYTQQSDTGPKSFRRYLLTVHHVVLWLTGDVWDDPNDEAYQSVRTVMNMHKSVAMDMKKNLKPKKKVYLSQYDMALVQCGFMGGIIRYAKGFGLSCTDKQMSDYVYCWRCIGYLLGIKDEYNLCSGSYEETKSICEEIEQRILLPAMAQPPKGWDTITNAYIDGVNLNSPLRMHSYESIVAFAYDSIGISIPKLCFQDKLRFWFHKMIVWCVLRIPYFETVLNWLMLNHIRKTYTSKIKN